MFRSYWIAVFALGLILATNAYADPITKDSNHQPVAEQGQSQAIANTQPSPFVAVQDGIERIARAIETANSKEPSTDEKKAAQDDIKAQMDMAKWAKWMLIIGALEVGATLFGIFLVWKTLVATQQQVNIAKISADDASRIGRAQVRGYLSSEGAELTYQGILVWVEAQLTNRGQSPIFSGDCTAALVVTSQRNKAIQYKMTGGFGVLAAGQSGVCRLHVLRKEIGEDVLEEIQAGTRRLFIHATFKWEDVFDTEAWAVYGFDQIGSGLKDVTVKEESFIGCEMSATCINASRKEDQSKT